MPESPFRFVVIDDPVQAMDPAKVAGLATVLARAARERQVIVLTHDTRLADAMRALDIAATVIGGGAARAIRGGAAPHPGSGCSVTSTMRSRLRRAGTFPLRRCA